MILEIKAKKEKSFIGDEGDEIQYFWYTALRREDGVTIKFGSMRGDHKVGQVEEIELEKSEKVAVKNGNKKIVFVYKEVFQK